jgi:hypothetical protein
MPAAAAAVSSSSNGVQAVQLGLAGQLVEECQLVYLQMVVALTLQQQQQQDLVW